MAKSRFIITDFSGALLSLSWKTVGWLEIKIIIVQDDTQVATFKNNVSGIVMGRSLIKGNIRNNIKRLIDHLNQ